MKKAVSFALVLILGSTIGGLAKASTITVGPGGGYDFDNIQAGIDAADDGDTVLVAPGEYVITEPITFRGKAITVKSEVGPDETTIRMGTPADTNRGSVVVFENGETTESILEGFTITRGSGFFVPIKNARMGGGIYFNASSGIVRDCAIVQNRTIHGGGVCCVHQCSTVLLDCIIAENSASGGVGGGVCYINDSSVTMNNCTIRDNSSTVAGGGVWFDTNTLVTMNNCIIKDNNSTTGEAGGGVACYQDSSLIMSNCVIINNTIQNDGGGIYVGTGHCSGTLLNCVIAGNTASLWGGGGVMCSWPGNSLTIRNCTIWGNSGGSRWGGGGVLCRGASVAIINSIIWGNTAPMGREISVEDPPSTLAIKYSNVGGGQAGVNVESGCALDWGEGNIDADPLFALLGYLDKKGTRNSLDDVWVDSDFHLKSKAGRWDPNSQSWLLDDVTSPCIDAGDPNSDWTGEVWPHGERTNMGAYGGTSQASLSLSDAGAIVYLQWLGQASLKIWTERVVIYVDPWQLSNSPHDATLVLITHSHPDHYSTGDIAKVWSAETELIGASDVVAQYGKGQAIMPGQTIESSGVHITGVAMYNHTKFWHPKAENWVGLIIEFGSERIYVAGDTDLTEEMKALSDIDVAILPVRAVQTMSAADAAEATKYIKPKLAIPYHWGDSQAPQSNAERFAELVECNVKIMTVGESISSEDWSRDFSFIAHWKLDETEGRIAYDSIGVNDGICHGEPLWQPVGGKLGGALEFDGINDYVETDLILSPAEGPFSVFAWIKGGAPGQAVLSQASGMRWLCTDPSGGNLMTELKGPGRSSVPLLSQTIINDDNWHRIGLVWDGSHRTLYVDGIAVAEDTQTNLVGSDSGLYLGCGKAMEPGSFWSGLIDDVRIYNRVVIP